MAITFIPGGAAITRLWPDFKMLVDGTIKSLQTQFEDETEHYVVFAFDGAIFYYTTIYKLGFEPINYTPTEIADNSTWLTDFLTNYEPASNKQSSLTGGSTVAHYNSTATTTAATVALTTTGTALVIHNLDALNDLLVSFDGGTKFKTVIAGDSLSLDVVIANFVVKSSAGSVDFEALVVS